MKRHVNAIFFLLFGIGFSLTAGAYSIETKVDFCVATNKVMGLYIHGSSRPNIR